MITKSKEMITLTICNEIERLIKSQINLRLRQIPRSISVSQIFKFLTPTPKFTKSVLQSDSLFDIDQNV